MIKTPHIEGLTRHPFQLLHSYFHAAGSGGLVQAGALLPLGSWRTDWAAIFG